MFFFFWVFLFLGFFSDAAKILVYSPTVSFSHMISNARVAEALASDGHNVTLLQLDYAVDPNVRLVEKATLWPATFEWPNRAGFFDKRLFADFLFAPIGPLAMYLGMRSGQIEALSACEHILHSTEILEKIRSSEFDIFIGEQLNLCGSGIAAWAGIPTHILMHSCPLLRHSVSFLGIPNPVSSIPATFHPNPLPHRMSFFDRLVNFLYSVAEYSLLMGNAVETTELFRKHFGSDFPDVTRVAGESPLVLLNVDEFVDFPRPIGPNVVHIGGLGIDDEKIPQLSEEFSKEMSKGKLGVIFVSLGTLVPSRFLPQKFVDNFIQTVRNLGDFHFVMKVDENDTRFEEISHSVDNLFVTDWAPQTAILANSRIRLFVTHGGYNSVMESARSGVPIVSIGFFGDQSSNGAAVQRNGWGLAISRFSLLDSHLEFEETLRRVLFEESFSKKAKRIQKLIRTKPTNAHRRLTESIRFLVENGGHLPELLLESRNIGFVEFYSLDLAAFGFAIFFVLFVFLYSFFRCFVGFFVSKVKTE